MNSSPPVCQWRWLDQAPGGRRSRLTPYCVSPAASPSLVRARLRPETVVHARPGQQNFGWQDYIAFSKICTHAGCTVNFSPGQDIFACPCHGSVFDAKTGAVLQGPAVTPLPKFTLRERQGKLYISS